MFQAVSNFQVVTHCIHAAPLGCVWYFVTSPTSFCCRLSKLHVTINLYIMIWQWIPHIFWTHCQLHTWKQH